MTLQDNKFLAFDLNGENYAIQILKIKEIIEMMDITHVPKLPSHMKGVINLRGKIIPVMDLRLRFGLESMDYNDRTSIIVLELETDTGIKTTGIIVDRVQEVLELNEEQISSMEEVSENGKKSYLYGMGKLNEKVIMLINVEKLIHS